jgi:hypothetical protein
MKQVKLLFFLSILLLIILSCEDKELQKPQTFVASDGTYLGVVHLAYENIPDAENYQAYRLNNQTAEWVEIAWTQSTYWDDYGMSLPEGKIIPGQVYQYKFRPHSDDASFGPYSEIETGYAYDPEEVTITEISRDREKNKITITWTDPNEDGSLSNLVYKEYKIYKADSDYPESFDHIGNTTNLSYEDSYINKDKVYYYKVAIYYQYHVVRFDNGAYDDFMEIESEATKEGTGGSGPGIVEYDRTDLGTAVSSGEGIVFLEMKDINSTLYMGVLKDADALDYGQPGIYKFNGSSWEETVSSFPGDITASTSIGDIGIAGGTGKLYLGALGQDSIYLFSYEGSSWSENLASKNLGATGEPSAFDLEVLDNIPYLAIEEYPDYDLKVLKRDGSSWATVGGDGNGFITTGVNIFGTTLENFGGTLYLYYLVQNSDYNATLTIKHLDGTSWVTDLEWTTDNVLEFKMAKGSGDIYILTRSQTIAEYKGGIYKVTSTSTVEALVSEEDDWFIDPLSITVDSDGDVIITSTIIESQTLIYPALSVYDGSSWGLISGDFTDGDTPLQVKAQGTTIYYVYGDRNNQTTWNTPKALKSLKFTK